MRRRNGIAIAAAWLLLLALRAVTPPAPARHLGEWKVVVVQSDDWGLEGWFPDAEVAAELADACDEVAPALHAYCSSTLESAADVDALRQLLGGVRDVDGNPAVLQANTVVAGVDLGAPRPTLRPSGDPAGAFARPGLAAAVDEAIEARVWWPELHGLTHYDLVAYEAARRRGDPLAERAAARGVVAFDGWSRRTEMGHPARAAATVTEAVRRFTARFGRAPVSIIAPDYRWGAADEDAFAAAGLEVVQAKREQIDRTLAPGSWRGRVRKVWNRWRDYRRDRFVYLDRPVRLEPYGDASDAAPQGVARALADARAAWRRGDPAVVSIHRVQLVNLDPAIATVGRAQLGELLQALAAAGGRFLVDDEVAQLTRHGVSVHTRGGVTTVRNYTGSPRWVQFPDGTRARVRVGTHRGAAP